MSPEKYSLSFLRPLPPFHHTSLRLAASDV